MNQAMVTELALGLRRVDAFPAVAIAAIEQTIQSYAHYKRKGPWNPDFVVGIVFEFIYRIPQNPVNVKRTKLKTVQRLEVAEILLSRLSAIEADDDRMMLFSTFFPNECVTIPNGNVPHSVLSLMTSLAVATKNEKILSTIANWILTIGVDNQAVFSIARDVATDFRTDEQLDKYFHLPETAFLFSSVLLLAIAKLFNTNSPPKRLVQQVVQWVECCPSVCFIPPHSAVFDLFRWVVNSDDDLSRLHKAILEAIATEKPGVKTQLQIIPQILTLISDLRMKFEAMSSNNMSNPEITKTTTIRLLQLIGVLIGAQCLDRNEMHPIFEALDSANFPSTQLYTVMKSNYLKFESQPPEHLNFSGSVLRYT